MIARRKTRKIMIGPFGVGGNAPISVQSMTNTNTADYEATIAQINELSEVGCELVRVAVPDMAAARAITAIR
ncbi:MAG TPA: 4-hydroxy-3-methylbut-2-en-1-yl diphosphate synthase, partial [Desulfofustis sp.]|nr:4-hydroxy-3-methylbut-2-en-1-yl diphosphate synthase [Desulfofustis sp.]